MQQQRRKLPDRSEKRCIQPELLAKYDANNVTFTAWLASVEQTMYRGQNCYTLQFNLHFMNGLTERKRLRAATFEVEVQSTSGIEAPELLFVRQIGKMDPIHNQETSPTSPSAKAARAAGERHDSPFSLRRRKSHDSTNSMPVAKLVQGIVLPPRAARWKVSEPPGDKRGIPPQVKLQALIRCPGPFGIEVKDFQVRVGYSEWMWPNRLLRAIPRSRTSGVPISPAEANKTANPERTSFVHVVPPSKSVEDLCRAPPNSRDTLIATTNFNARRSNLDLPKPQSRPQSILLPVRPPPTTRDIDAYRGTEDARHLLTSFQTWLDASQNFDGTRKLELPALTDFMSALYPREQTPQNPAASSLSLSSGLTARRQIGVGNSTKMNALISQLNTECDLLEAWVRRERLKKQATEICPDAAGWKASPNVEGTAPQNEPHVPKPERRLEIMFEGPKPGRHQSKDMKPRCNEAKVEKRVQFGADETSMKELKAERRASLALDVQHTNRDPLKGEGLRRSCTMPDGKLETSAAKQSTNFDDCKARAKEMPTAGAEGQLSPSRAWRALSPLAKASTAR